MAQLRSNVKPGTCRTCAAYAVSLLAQSLPQDERLVPPAAERLPVATAATDPLPLRMLDNFVLFVTDDATGVAFLAGLQQLSNGAGALLSAGSQIPCHDCKRVRCAFWGSLQILSVLIGVLRVGRRARQRAAARGSRGAVGARRQRRAAGRAAAAPADGGPPARRPRLGRRPLAPADAVDRDRRRVVQVRLALC